MNNQLRALRGTLLVPLAILVAACATTTTSPSPTPSPAATAAASAAGGGGCSPDDLALTGGAWGAAAGSRGAEVSVENRGSAACTLPAGPSVAILDAAGTAIIESQPADEPGPTLEPGAVTTFTILFSNWCEEGAALPLHVVLRSGSTGIAIPGLDMAADDVPPCNGPGQPATLSANPWQPLEG